MITNPLVYPSLAMRDKRKPKKSFVLLNAAKCLKELQFDCTWLNNNSFAVKNSAANLSNFQISLDPDFGGYVKISVLTRAANVLNVSVPASNGIDVVMKLRKHGIIEVNKNLLDQLLTSYAAKFRK